MYAQIPPQNPRVQWLPNTVPQASLPHPYVGLGDLNIDHDWRSMTTKVKATGESERILAWGLLALGVLGVVAHAYAQGQARRAA